LVRNHLWLFRKERFAKAIGPLRKGKGKKYFQEKGEKKSWESAKLRRIRFLKFSEKGYRYEPKTKEKKVLLKRKKSLTESIDYPRNEGRYDVRFGNLFNWKEKDAHTRAINVKGRYPEGGKGDRHCYSTWIKTTS